MTSKALIIQGRIDHACLRRTIATYIRSFDEIILSTYAEEVASFGALPAGVKVVVNSTDIPVGAYNGQNLYLQTRTTLAGVQASSSDYCIKIRADEYYTGLDRQVYTPSKLLMNNVFFSPLIKYHIGDHVLGAPRDIMEAMLVNVLNICKSPVKETAEQVLFKGYLQAVGDSGEGSWDSLIAKHLDILYIEDLQPLCIKYNTVKAVFRSAEQYYTSPHVVNNKSRGVLRKPGTSTPPVSPVHKELEGCYDPLPTKTLEEFTKGWLVGNFLPSLIKLPNIEVGVKYYKAGDKEDWHIHNIVLEYTIILSGVVSMRGHTYVAKDIVVVNPKVPTNFECIEDAITLVIKTPSRPLDKTAVKGPII